MRELYVHLQSIVLYVRSWVDLYVRTSAFCTRIESIVVVFFFWIIDDKILIFAENVRAERKYLYLKRVFLWCCVCKIKVFSLFFSEEYIWINYGIWRLFRSLSRITQVNSKIIHIIGAQIYEEFGTKIPSQIPRNLIKSNRSTKLRNSPLSKTKQTFKTNNNRFDNNNQNLKQMRSKFFFV